MPASSAPPQTLDEIYNFITVNDLGGTASSDNTLGKLLLAFGAAIRTGVNAAPFLVVSPIGLSTAGVLAPNNGAPFGPDTSGTTTCGIQEAFNSLPTMTVYPISGTSVTLTGRVGDVRLLRGVFNTTSLITIPAGTIRFRGVGCSTWQYVTGIPSPTTNLGGSQIVGAASLATTGVISCPQAIGSDSNPYPATQLDFGDMDVRIVSPALAQTSSAPDIIDLAGFMRGSITNLIGAEIAAGGGTANNMWIVVDIDPGPSTDEAIVTNVAGIGGSIGVRFNKTHIFAANIFGGQQAGSISGTGTGSSIFLGGNLDNNFYNLHAYFSPIGVTFYPYTFGTQPQPVIIRGMHFEGLTSHYVSPAAAASGMLIIDGPIWQSPTVGDPRTDVRTLFESTDSLPWNYGSPSSNGYAILTKNELDEQGYGADKTVFPTPGSLTAGTSPYTFPAQPFPCTFIITTLGGATAWKLDATALPAPALGNAIHVAAEHVLQITWATTAPVVTVVPECP
jgi:hypothetical protein